MWNIAYLVGSNSYGVPSRAHLLQHLAFKGTLRHPNIPSWLTETGQQNDRYP
ncbi:insulinase family protein [Anditalea andensis]|uniref:insulinase family protein n=1 Tax=Anditalea andensis TaxID=1048983 RepID=UPI0013DF5C6F|nr:insulinase family protein [Anditalea andensis]